MSSESTSELPQQFSASHIHLDCISDGIAGYDLAWEGPIGLLKFDPPRPGGQPGLVMLVTDDSRVGLRVLRGNILVNDQPVVDHWLRPGDRIAYGQTVLQWSETSTPVPPDESTADVTPGEALELDHGELDHGEFDHGEFDHGEFDHGELGGADHERPDPNTTEQVVDVRRENVETDQTSSRTISIEELNQARQQAADQEPQAERFDCLATEDLEFECESFEADDAVHTNATDLDDAPVPIESDSDTTLWESASCDSTESDTTHYDTTHCDTTHCDTTESDTTESEFALSDAALSSTPDSAAADSVADDNFTAKSLAPDCVAADSVALDSPAEIRLAEDGFAADKLAADTDAAESVAEDNIEADCVAEECLAAEGVSAENVIEDRFAISNADPVVEAAATESPQPVRSVLPDLPTVVCCEGLFPVCYQPVDLGEMFFQSVTIPRADPDWQAIQCDWIH